MRNKQQRFLLPLLCAAAVLVSLALPPAVFALWDEALLGAPHSQEVAADGLSAEGYDDPIACLLYDCAHLLNVYVGQGADRWGGWTQVELTGEHRQQLYSVLATLQEAGLLDEALLSAALPGEAAAWQVSTAPGGLICYTVREDLDPADARYLNLIYTPQGQPVFFDLQHGGADTAPAVRPGTAAAYRDALQLDHFDDWQMLDENSRPRDAGEIMYSAKAQLYLTANYRTGVTLSVSSMTPQEFAALNGR